ncbi:MAG: aminopeptidase [Bacteroidetes bacterium]|nr:aminopeptidase [Bacteroidota bacterium]
MPIAFRAVFFGVLFCSLITRGQSIPDSIGQPGVSLPLAKTRAALVKDIHYELLFNLPLAKDSLVRGKEKLTFRLVQRPAFLLLDFKTDPKFLDIIRINGKTAPVVYANEHIQLPGSLLQEGTNSVELGFVAGNAALNRNTEFLYTLLVPDRARTLFPCFDQPNLKAVFELTLVKPAGWQAIANASLLDSSRMEDLTVLRFRPSDRISTYLFSFAAGRFTAADKTVHGLPMRMLYRETDPTKIRLSTDTIFHIEGSSLEFLESYTALKYPFQKFDFVAIPDFQFGGMEHPGAIQYKANTLFLDSGATREQLIARSNLLAHETAHMWFGDLVTMDWFNDVWMKEVFANFMADMIGNLTIHDNNDALKFLTYHYPAAYSVDRSAGAHPIRQKLDNLNEAGSLYGNIIYHKAPIVMRQLELLMGVSAFRDGLRDYLKKYAGGNATWPDLIEALQRHTSLDLRTWNEVWVNGAGRPVFSYELKEKDGKIGELTIRQKGEDGSQRFWPQQFYVMLVYPDSFKTLLVNSNASSIKVPEAAGLPKPQYILFNVSGLGYGVFPVDAGAVAFSLSSGAPAGKGPVARAAEYINLYENMLNGRVLTPRQLLDYQRHMLSGETVEQSLNVLLDQLQSVFWRFLTPVERESLAGTLEKECWQAMEAASAKNVKKLLFRTFSNIVTTRAGMDSLYTIWKEQRPPAGVILSEDDYTGLAAGLAIRNYPGSQLILQEQLSRIPNKDRQDRLRFLLPSLSNDEAVRDRFFATLQSAEARRKEAWVLTAIGYLHHPLRAASAEKYLQPSLDWLEDIQRTGDVFFPQSWLQAGFGWCRTSSEIKIVRNFLEKHPDYNPKLKAKILQATDLLFRTERVH